MIRDNKKGVYLILVIVIILICTVYMMSREDVTLISSKSPTHYPEPPKATIRNVDLDKDIYYSISMSKWNSIIFYHKKIFYQELQNCIFSCINSFPNPVMPETELLIDFGGEIPDKIKILLAYGSNKTDKDALLPTEEVPFTYMPKENTYKITLPALNDSERQIVFYSIETEWGTNICEYIMAVTMESEELYYARPVAYAVLTKNGLISFEDLYFSEKIVEDNLYRVVEYRDGTKDLQNYEIVFNTGLDSHETILSGYEDYNIYEHLIAAKKGGLWGFYNKETQKQVVGHIYEEIADCSELEGEREVIKVKHNGAWYSISNKGEIILKGKIAYDNYHTSIVLYTSKGEFVFEPRIIYPNTETCSFDNRIEEIYSRNNCLYYKANIADKYGLYTNEGKEILEPIFDVLYIDTLQYDEDVIFVKKEKQWGGLFLKDDIVGEVDWQLKPSNYAQLINNNWLYEGQREFYVALINKENCDITDSAKVFFYNYFKENPEDLKYMRNFTKEEHMKWDDLNLYVYMIAVYNNTYQRKYDGTLTKDEFDFAAQKYLGDISYTHQSSKLFSYDNGVYRPGGFSFHGWSRYELTKLKKVGFINGDDIYQAYLNVYDFDEISFEGPDRGSPNERAIWEETNSIYSENTDIGQRIDYVFNHKTEILEPTSEIVIEFTINDPLDDIYFTYLSCERREIKHNWLYDGQKELYLSLVHDNNLELSNSLRAFFYDYEHKKRNISISVPEFKRGEFPDWNDILLFAYNLNIYEHYQQKQYDVVLTDDVVDRIINKYFALGNYKHKSSRLFTYNDGIYEPMGFGFGGFSECEIKNIEKYTNDDGLDFYRAQLYFYHFHEDAFLMPNKGPENEIAIWNLINSHPKYKDKEPQEVLKDIIRNGAEGILKPDVEKIIEFTIHEPKGDIYLKYLSCEVNFLHER